MLDPEKRELYVFAPSRTFHLSTDRRREPAEVDFGAGGALIDLAAIIPRTDQYDDPPDSDSAPVGCQMVLISTKARSRARPGGAVKSGRPRGT